MRRSISRGAKIPTTLRWKPWPRGEAAECVGASQQSMDWIWVVKKKQPCTTRRKTLILHSRRGMHQRMVRSPEEEIGLSMDFVPVASMRLQADGQSMGRGDWLGSSCVQLSVEDDDAAAGSSGAAAVRGGLQGLLVDVEEEEEDEDELL
ncbi:hypothetical protein LA080_013464 [Diaporthe eres]|nr:hypothetical protein LA080_013464 [Diaporthe eres]